jgi:hypothetical protein
MEVKRSLEFFKFFLAEEGTCVKRSAEGHRPSGLPPPAPYWAAGY